MELLELAADILGRLADEMVFVGGATTHLWISEETAPAVRATDDVDVICDVTSYAEYQSLSERLRGQGLQEATNERVICRWRDAKSGLAIDVMPIAEKVLASRTPGIESESKPRSSERSLRERPSRLSRLQSSSRRSSPHGKDAETTTSCAASMSTTSSSS